MKFTWIRALLAGAVLVGASLGIATAAEASSKKPVSGYIVAWRQIDKTLLVAYKAHNNTKVAQKNASCSIHAKPNFKLAKPGYYALPAQRFSLEKASSKYTYIGQFSLPALPKKITITHVGLSCS